MSDNQKNPSDKNEPQKAAGTGIPEIGGVRIVRRITKHPFWQDSDRLKAWLDLLLLARDSNGETTSLGQRIILKRGHVYKSIRQLQERWQRSYEWIKAFLKFATELHTIKVTISKHGTDIEIVNYDTYNPADPNHEWLKILAQSGETVTAPESHSGTPEKPNQKGISKKESGDTPPNPFPEVPSEVEVLEFCKTFTDLSRGIGCIPEAYGREWYAYRLDINRFPIKWRESLKNRFLSDFTAGKSLARGEVYKSAGYKNAQAPVREVGELCHMIGSNKSQTPRTAELDAELAQLEAELQKATGWGS